MPRPKKRPSSIRPAGPARQPRQLTFVGISADPVRALVHVRDSRSVRLYLINPHNPLVSLVKKSRWSKYRVWKPLGLLVLAGLTPPEWKIRIIDENLGVPDYGALPRPDLVGITAFTSQAPRAYELAGEFRDRGVPVVMGGVHAPCAWKRRWNAWIRW